LSIIPITTNLLRISLAQYLKKLGKTISDANRNKILEKRRRLQSRIDSFHADAGHYLNIQELNCSNPSHDDSHADDFTDSEAESENGDESDADAGPEVDKFAEAEHTLLMLPSAFGNTACISAGHIHAVKHELRLRIGQANDALQELRVQLGHKAFLFRTSIRKANSQRKKTRAFSFKDSIESLVKLQYFKYSSARSAMIQLGASEDILKKYQTITKADLKITTIAHDPSIHGQRNSALPWFWTMDADQAAAESDWMLECNS
jgi:hypothetical protein